MKHGVLDERLNVHGVKNLKVSDLSVCPDNVGCNTFSVSRFMLVGGSVMIRVANECYNRPLS